MKRVMLLAAAMLLSGGAAAADVPAFEGFKACVKCHGPHEKAWQSTVHAKAFDSLKTNVKAEAKIRAKLDPTKDYSADPACLSCHTTGFGEPGGYAVDLPPARARLLAGVTCEACHGPGSLFRHQHGEAENRLKRDGEATERGVLVAAGQNYAYQAVCTRCHLNYEGSGWAGAKAPFTPFTPAVDGKYAFDFAKAVRGEAIHTHYKLAGVFKGEPLPALRAEFQKTAVEPE